MKRTKVDEIMEYLTADQSRTLTMNSARDLCNCQCLSQTVQKANRRLAGTGFYIKNTNQIGSYGIYQAVKIERMEDTK